MLYTALLDLHNVLRWVVLVACVLALVRAFRGQTTGRAGLVFTIALDTQVLVGLLMYFAVSPTVRAAMSNVPAAMKDHALRFWLVEHPFAMLVALALAHVARVRERRGKKGTFTLLAIALTLVLVSIPWPFLPYGRPLLSGM